MFLGKRPVLTVWRPLRGRSPIYFSVGPHNAQTCPAYRSPCTFKGLWEQPTAGIPRPSLESEGFLTAPTLTVRAAYDAADLTGATRGVFSLHQDKSSRDFSMQPSSPATPVASPLPEIVLARIDTLAHDRLKEELAKLDLSVMSLQPGIPRGATVVTFTLLKSLQLQCVVRNAIEI